MHSVLQIADAFIRLGIENNKPLTHLQVQKLCFLAQGYSLAISGEPIFRQEIKAWPYGPVIPYLYTRLKRFGGEPIRDKEALPTFPLKEENQSYTTSLIDVIYSGYGDCSGGELSNLTHLPDTPWDIVWNREKFSTIPTSLIKSYYKNELKDLIDVE
ncbi:DUF4065 domain-containing protein [Cardiobacteriaceae bacterium TAE3-ERU3]|nr:DUF4065 domain-containing protein [Cardiobacteriaceae bacterium TAE3-ERU3]